MHLSIESPSNVSEVVTVTISINKQDFGEIRLGRNFNYSCEDDHNSIIPLNYSLIYKFLIQIIQFKKT